MTDAPRETATTKARRIKEACATLSPREKEVLVAMAGGDADAEIAKRMGLSHHTIKTHARAAFKTLGVTNRTQLLTTIGVPDVPLGRKLERVTRFQRAVLEGVARGHKDGQIAIAQGVAPNEVKSTIRALLRHLDLPNRTKLGAWYLGATGRAKPLCFEAPE